MYVFSLVFFSPLPKKRHATPVITSIGMLRTAASLEGGRARASTTIDDRLCDDIMNISTTPLAHDTNAPDVVNASSAPAHHVGSVLDARERATSLHGVGPQYRSVTQIAAAPFPAGDSRVRFQPSSSLQDDERGRGMNTHAMRSLTVPRLTVENEMGRGHGVRHAGRDRAATMSAWSCFEKRGLWAAAAADLTRMHMDSHGWSQVGKLAEVMERREVQEIAQMELRIGQMEAWASTGH